MGYELTLQSVYTSLGHLLETLATRPEVQASPECAQQVQHAIFFHRQLWEELQGLLRDKAVLQQQLYERDTGGPHTGCVERHQDSFCKYQGMQQAGLDVAQVAAAVQADGLNHIQALRVLRALFALSLADADQVLRGERPLHEESL